MFAKEKRPLPKQIYTEKETETGAFGRQHEGKLRYEGQSTDKSEEGEKQGRVMFLHAAVEVESVVCDWCGAQDEGMQHYPRCLSGVLMRFCTCCVRVCVCVCE